jgi:ubiquinone/menaquinone biosynthesis C-methylase UbiE
VDLVRVRFFSFYNLEVIGRIFIALCNIPGLKKFLWRTWYDYLARSHQAPEWTFMNYGYSSTSEPDKLVLVPADDADRHWIQLYHHVAGAIDLQGSRVLEVGSGRGGGASFIKRYLKPEHMIGIDLSKQAVQLSRKRHCVDGLEFRVGDAERLPFEDGTIDAVINVESSHCYPSFDRFLAEVCRVLRPGGHFLYADFRARESLEAWGKSLQDSGLTLLRQTDITPNVVAALERDNERKLVLINRLVPRPLRTSFLDFAAVKGSALFEGFSTGRYSYRSYVLQRPNI